MMLCNPVYIVKQFITSKPTPLDVIGVNITMPCVTYTFRVTDMSSLSSNVVYRFLGSVYKLYGAVKPILRY